MILFELRLIVFNIIFTKMSVFPFSFHFLDFLVYRVRIFLLYGVLNLIHFLLDAFVDEIYLCLFLFGFIHFGLISFSDVFNFVLCLPITIFDHILIARQNDEIPHIFAHFIFSLKYDWVFS